MFCLFPLSQLRANYPLHQTYAILGAHCNQMHRRVALRVALLPCVRPAKRVRVYSESTDIGLG